MAAAVPQGRHCRWVSTPVLIGLSQKASRTNALMRMLCSRPPAGTAQVRGRSKTYLCTERAL